MINVPESVQHGTVKMHIISGSADSKADDDLRPDAAPVNGTIILKPTVSSLKVTSATPPTTMLLDTLRCPIIEGVLYPPGTKLDETETTLEGVILVSSDQPATQPTSLQWQATFDLSSTTKLSPITFNVPVNSVIDLTTVIPAAASPGTVNVITTETADRAEHAAALAELAAERAENASLEDIDYDLILGRVEPLVDDAVAVGLSGVGDLVSEALAPYATTVALTQGLAEKQPVGDYATKAELPDVSGLATTAALTAGLAGKQDAGDYATTAVLTEGLAGKQDAGDYALVSQLPDVSGLATKSALASGLAEKQPVGDYATTAALTSGLATKQPVGDYATKDELPDLTAYATTAYVDQTVGDIDTALSGILGGE